MTAARPFLPSSIAHIIAKTVKEVLIPMILPIISVKGDVVPRAADLTARIMCEVPGLPTIAPCVTASFTDRTVNVIMWSQSNVNQ